METHLHNKKNTMCQLGIILPCWSEKIEIHSRRKCMVKSSKLISLQEESGVYIYTVSCVPGMTCKPVMGATKTRTKMRVFCEVLLDRHERQQENLREASFGSVVEPLCDSCTEIQVMALD